MLFVYKCIRGNMMKPAFCSIVQRSVLGSLGALILSLGSGVVLAQEEQLEEITVTGSRIARDANLTGALPVQSVDSQEIQMSGEFSITDVVNDVPALLSSTSSESSIDSGFADGANVLSLRGLGASRTLVLVDGRRHVGGVQGSSAVDIGSIPSRLVERVEVLTGGASAIYGADAVTGVVNFIMKDNFEGFEVDASYGVSDHGDAGQTAITATWGTNFASDRGNIAVSVDYRTDEGLTMGDRPGAQIGTGGDWANPALRFQQGDIGAGTPLFAEYYNYNNTGLIHYGLPIPSAADFVADYNSAFGTSIGQSDLSSAEMALIVQGATAPQRAVHPEHTFPFTSGYGYIGAGNAFNWGGWDPDVAVDVNGNGTPDCQETFYGYNSTFAAASFGAVGGCWVVGPTGGLSVIEDGLVAGNFAGFGGSSYDVYREDWMSFLLPDDKVTVNVMGNYDLTDSMSLFAEMKYVRSETDRELGSNSFWDLLYGAPDNPYLPEQLKDVCIAAGGCSTTYDPVGFDSVNETVRETARAVIGLEGELNNGWAYELSANYGRYEENGNDTNHLVIDRFFAAIDAVIDPATGEAACRSSVDPTAPAGNTPFGIPSYEGGYFSFIPGDGQCQPLNIWAGREGINQTRDGANFATRGRWSSLAIDQLVLAGFLTGDSSDYFELPAGPISFAAGFEYRDESSDAKFDPWERGVIPNGSAFPAGTMLSDHSANSSLMFRPQLSTKNEYGQYDVTDIYVEASIPLLVDAPLARELTLDVAARSSNYSTIGQTTTWKANVIWAPINSMAFRGTFSEAVRAPNITELYGPTVGLNFRPDDPCDVTQINAIAGDNPQLAAQTQANCESVFATIGLDPTLGTGSYAFVDPLSASFGGLTGGNPNLLEEVAETSTVGFVIQPEAVEGLSLSVDYWDISIEGAISAVSSQNIVDGCYQGAALNEPFCALTGRNSDPLSAQFGGFNFLRQTTLNFAKVETDGVDVAIKWAFELGAHGFDVTVMGTSVDQINNYENPLLPDEVNPELVEINRPEVAGNVFLNWYYGDLRVGWQTQYIGEMLYGGIEVETAETLYGSSVFRDAVLQHDLNASYVINDNLMVYGGIKNVTGEMPWITENAFPHSPRGTFYFMGLNWTSGN